MKSLFIYFFIGIVFTLVSCKNDISKQPGICLSFDDNYLEQWVEILPILEKYDAKTTFFLTGVGSLNDQEKIWLKQIRDAGHEIGAHGEYHLSMNTHIKENGLRNYWRKEIKEHLRSFENIGIQPQVFAYPFGEKNHYIDFFLLNQFKATRNVASKKEQIEDIEEIYHRPNTRQKRFYSLGIDNKEHITHAQLENALTKAKNKGEIIFLHAHNIGDQEGYEISIANLTRLLILTQDLKLNFYSYSDLID